MARSTASKEEPSRSVAACPRTAFRRSSLGPEVRDLLWVPPSAPPHDASAGRVAASGRDEAFPGGGAHLHLHLHLETTAAAAADDDTSDDDEGWRFTSDGLIDWNRAPELPAAPGAPPSLVSDGDDAVRAVPPVHAAAANVLKALARASLRRVTGGTVRVSDDGAHAGALRNILRRLRAAAGGAGDAGDASVNYLALTLSLSVLERRCVDLHVTSSGGTDGACATPARGLSPLLSEVLASDSLRAALAGREGDGGGVWALQQALHPLCMNLRNVVWHGFIAPEDVQPELAALACILAASVPGPPRRPMAGLDAVSDEQDAVESMETHSTDGKTSCDVSSIQGDDGGEGLGGRTLRGHDCELEAHFPQIRGRWDGGGGGGESGSTSISMVAAAVSRVLGASTFLSDGWRAPTAAAAAALLTRDDEAEFVAVACPALEHALRCRFAAVNAAPEVLEARAGQYYATLDGYGQAHVHDVLLHPLRAPAAGDAERRKNALPDALPAGVRSALEDLFMRDRGPALRAVYAHGSVALQPRRQSIRGGGGCARLLLLTMLDLCRAHQADLLTTDAALLKASEAADWRADSTALALAGATVEHYVPKYHPTARLLAAVDRAAEAASGLVGSYHRVADDDSDAIWSGSGMGRWTTSTPRFTFKVTGVETDAVTTAAAEMDPKTAALVFVYDTLRHPLAGSDPTADSSTVGKPCVTEVRTTFMEKAGKLGGSIAVDEGVLFGVVQSMLDATRGPFNSAQSQVSITVAQALASRLLLISTADAPVESYGGGAVILRPGLSPGAECLRAAADEVAAAAAAYLARIDELVGAVERREARSNHRRQLAALLHGQRSVAAGLVTVLLAVEGLAGDSGGEPVDDGNGDLHGDGTGDLGMARRRVLSYATSLRSACDAGQAAEAARVAASLWEQRAGRVILECLRRRQALAL